MLATIDIDMGELLGLESAWQVAPAIVREELEAAMTEADLLVQNMVVSVTPRRTGLLRGSIIGQELIGADSVIGIVGTSIDYALPVELGSRPHVIEAKDGGYLEFNVGGRTIYRKRVNHPGSKGAHMFSIGFTQAQPQVNALFAQARDRIAARIAGNSKPAGAPA